MEPARSRKVSAGKADRAGEDPVRRTVRTLGRAGRIRRFSVERQQQHTWRFDRDRTRPQQHRLEPPVARACGLSEIRSEEHTSELQSLMRISYAVFCLKQQNKEIN